MTVIHVFSHRSFNVKILRILLPCALSMVSGTTLAEQPTLSEQLLYTYFKTAGICTTSQVQNILDSGKLVTVEISIEAQTRKSILAMTGPGRDNWFSLHCPPEIHGVWHQESPPTDIQITGQIAPDQDYTLGCVEFQQNQWIQRDSTLRDKILKWLDKHLGQ